MALVDVTENVLEPSETEPNFDINPQIKNEYKERIQKAWRLLDAGVDANNVTLKSSLPMRMVRRLERGDEIREVFTEVERNDE